MILRIGAFVATLAVLLGVLLPIFAPDVGRGDLVAYWSASHLLAQGQSPYDPATMGEAQRLACAECLGPSGKPLHAWNPPWLMTLLLPLGALPFGVAVPVWAACNVLILGLVTVLSWQMLTPARSADDPAAERALLGALLAVFAFGPTLKLIEIGQISSVFLLSIVLGLWLLRSDHQRLAGAVFLLATIKPHMTWLVLLVLGAWILRARAWRVVQGGLLAIAGSVLVVTLLYPRWALDYVALLNQFPYSEVITSTLGSFVRERTGFGGLRFAGLLLLPLVVPLSARMRADERLPTINLALALSVSLAPFGFSFDHVVLVPVLVHIVAALWLRGRVDATAALVVAGLVAMNVALFVQQSGDDVPYDVLFWPPLAVLTLWATIRASGPGAASLSAAGR